MLGELFRGTAVERGAGRVLYRVWHWARYKVLPARLLGGASGTKFSLLGQNRLKWAFLGVLGEFCAGWAAGVGVLGEFCAGWAAGVGVLGEFCTGWAAGVGVLGEFCIGWVAGGGVRGAISHAIPLSVFQNLNSDR